MYDPLIALLAALLITAVLIVLFWPQRGLVPRWRQGRRMTRRVLSEDALKHIHKYETNGQTPTMASIAGSLNISLNETTDLIAEMEKDGLVHTERGEISLTDIGGFAARFLKVGAGTFIGAYWSIFDRPAFDFAQAFYRRLLAGLPIGQAVQEARLEIRPQGDPTWLAYTVFADPLA